MTCSTNTRHKQDLSPDCLVLESVLLTAAPCGCSPDMGCVSSPWSGRSADRGSSRLATPRVGREGPFPVALPTHGKQAQRPHLSSQAAPLSLLFRVHWQGSDIQQVWGHSLCSAPPALLVYGQNLSHPESRSLAGEEAGAQMV